MKCELCKKETGRPKKRFCGHYSEKGSCAYKNNMNNNLRRQKETQTALYSKNDGTYAKKKKRERELHLEDYVMAAKDSGYF